MKTAAQSIIVVAAIVVLVMGIMAMAEIPTMILPPWIIISICVAVMIAVSWGLGFLVKQLLGSDWRVLTFASIFVLLFSGAYLFSEHRPTVRVNVSASTVPKIRLFVLAEPSHPPEIIVNKYGIGYVSRAEFEQGFHPRIVKGDSDITHEIESYSKGALATTATDRHSYEYLSFELPGGAGGADIGIDSLLSAGAIDTMRLPGK